MIRKIAAKAAIFILTKYPVGVYNKGILNSEVIAMEKECCCTQKTKERSEKEYRSLINRLNRIEGQIRGIRNMVEQSAYCTDILVQVTAVSAALNAFNKELLASHIKTCVAEDIKNGKEETVDELVSTLQKLMR
jgi:DNA-binding FrmR family transcriptional regulator